MLRWIFLVLVTLLSLSPASAFLRGGSGGGQVLPPTFTPAWQSLKIGGGGLMNNIFVATSDNTMVTSANTYGAYLYRTTGTCSGADNGGWGTTYSAPCWEQLFTQTSAPLALSRIFLLQQGVLEIGVCNSNTNVAYAFYDKSLYVTSTLKSASASRTWAKTPLTTTINGNQGISAGTGRAIGCDPNNPDIIYAATPAGLNVAVNGTAGTSASFSVVSTAKVGTTGAIPSAIAFDPTSSTGTCSHYSGSPTCTQHFWVFTSGSGVYETYNGGNTFTLTTGGPTTAGGPGCGQGGYCLMLKSDQFGKVWASIGGASLYKYTPNGSAGGGTWTTSTPDVYNSSVAYFGIDTTSASAGALRIVASGRDGNISVTTNGASSWSTKSTNPWAASGSQPGWLGVAAQTTAGVPSYSTQDYVFDSSGDLRMAAGIGVWKIASASISSSATFQADSIGIENMVTNHIDNAPGTSSVLGFWDRGFFLAKNPDTFPAGYWPDSTYSGGAYLPINHGWAFDYAAGTGTFTGWANGDNNAPASSTDGGNTWTVWASGVTGLGTTGLGGDLAASTANNWAVVPKGTSGNLRYTTNGGSSWAASTIGSGFGGTISSDYQHGFHLVANRVTANTFCFIDNSSPAKLFASTDSGANFASTGATITNTTKYNDAFKSVPGQAGVAYYSAGNAGGSATSFTLYKITKTTTECDTVTTVNAAITDIYGMGFGAAVPGGNGFPTIYFWGAVSGVYGTYQINNGGTTAALINVPASQQTWPNNSADFIEDVAGDADIYGRVYVGHNGSSAAYIDTADACPWIGFSNIKPNQALTGASVTISAEHSGKVPVTGVAFYIDGVQIGSTQTGQTSYSVSLNASAQTPGAHTLKVQASGNGCALGGTGNSKSIPITTS